MCACGTGVLASGELDARAMDAIKELPSKELTAIFEELKTSNLEHVSNKSAFVCGLIKTTRQKARKLAKTGQVSSRRASPDDSKLKVGNQLLFICLSSTCGLIVIPCMRYGLTQSRSFAYVGPSTWNCLPQSMHLELLSLSPLQLRKRLKTSPLSGPSTHAIWVTLYNYLITLLWLSHFLSSSVGM